MINFRRGARSYQLSLAAMLIFLMGALENEGIYLVAHILLHMGYLNGFLV